MLRFRVRIQAEGSELQAAGLVSSEKVSQLYCLPLRKLLAAFFLSTKSRWSRFLGPSDPEILKESKVLAYAHL